MHRRSKAAVPAAAESLRYQGQGERQSTRRCGGLLSPIAACAICARVLHSEKLSDESDRPWRRPARRHLRLLPPAARPRSHGRRPAGHACRRDQLRQRRADLREPRRAMGQPQRAAQGAAVARHGKTRRCCSGCAPTCSSGCGCCTSCANARRRARATTSSRSCAWAPTAATRCRRCARDTGIAYDQRTQGILHFYTDARGIRRRAGAG